MTDSTQQAPAASIPEAAIEAAHKAWREQAALNGSIFEYNLRSAIEAAAQHMMSSLRAELVALANEFDGAEGGTVAYTSKMGAHYMRKNAHDQLIYIVENHIG